MLQLRWRISAEADDWVACLGIAASLTTMNPKHLLGWIHRAKSLHQLGRTQEAKDLLISVVDDFQSNPASFDAILLRVGSGGGSAPLAGEGRSGGV